MERKPSHANGSAQNNVSGDLERRQSKQSPDAFLIVMAGPGVGQMLQLTDDIAVVGREDAADLQILDGGVSRRHARLRPALSGAAYLVEDLSSSNGTKLNGAVIQEPTELGRGDKLQLGPETVIRVSYGDEPETQYAKRMARAVLRDDLTGAFNRRYFDDRLDAELAFASRHDSPLALLLVDIDGFKRVNDVHGHPCGDAVLQQFSRLLKGIVRAEDVLARHGGEKFAVICREISETQAFVVADRIVKNLRGYQFRHDGQIIKLTASIGISSLCGQGAADAPWLVQAADRAMSGAKKAGGDRIVLQRDIE